MEEIKCPMNKNDFTVIHAVVKMRAPLNICRNLCRDLMIESPERVCVAT